jgi:hypothetical protein
MSFAFQVDPGGEEWNDEINPEDRSVKIPVRTLRSVRLMDCSVVCAPAYSSTSVSAVPLFNSLDTQALDATWAGPTPRMLPATCPLEMRSKIISAYQQSSKARTKRERLLNFILA